MKDAQRSTHANCAAIVVGGSILREWLRFEKEGSEARDAQDAISRVCAPDTEPGNHRAQLSQNQSVERYRGRHPCSLHQSPTPDFLTLSVLTSGSAFVTLRPWKRTLSASDSRPTPGRPKAISYQL